MKWCFGKREIPTKDAEIVPEIHLKPFHETFRIVTFNMSAGVLYPNPATDKFRFKVILFVYATVTPVSLMIFIDIYYSWLRRDVLNIIRHGTIIIPFLLVLTKMYLMYNKRVQAQKIIEEINRDHVFCNQLPSSYQPIVKEHMKIVKFAEKYWLFIVVHCVMIFPFMSTVSNLYNYAYKSVPKKYMVHDLVLPFLPSEARFESPYFELMYIYMCYCCVIYFLNFVGNDGFFGIAINHACFKMRLYIKALQDALKEDDNEEIFEKMVGVIRAQCRVYRFVDTIQETFNFWLAMIFTGTVVHVCNCMYQIMEGIGFDLKYLIFIAGSVVHIYLPCNFASKLKTMATDTSTMIYCSGWETVDDQRIRKMIIFMIARAQLPTVITAFNVLTFDMELFVSILHTSYSMFTLLRPRQ